MEEISKNQKTNKRICGWCQVRWGEKNSQFIFEASAIDEDEGIWICGDCESKAKVWVASPESCPYLYPDERDW